MSRGSQASIDPPRATRDQNAFAVKSLVTYGQKTHALLRHHATWLHADARGAAESLNAATSSQHLNTLELIPDARLAERPGAGFRSPHCRQQADERQATEFAFGFIVVDWDRVVTEKHGQLVPSVQHITHRFASTRQMADSICSEFQTCKNDGSNKPSS
jgi:hypothetical protein